MKIDSFFRCNQCDHVFESKRSSDMARCPKCSNIVVNTILDVDLPKKEEIFAVIKGKKHICERCACTYYSIENQQVMLCEVCRGINTPFASVVVPKTLTKYEFKKYRFEKELDFQFNLAKDQCNALLRSAEIFGFSDQEKLEISDFIIDYVKKLNKNRGIKLNQFFG